MTAKQLRLIHIFIFEFNRHKRFGRRSKSFKTPDYGRL